MKKVTVYTDGGSRGNPGPAGAGWVIEYGGNIKKNSKYLGEQTNNWAEYEAVILAFADLKKLIPKAKRKNVDVELCLDSELVARQLRAEYQVKEHPLQLQYMKVHNIRVADFSKLTVTHVPREKNNLADGLANEAMNNGTGTLL